MIIKKTDIGKMCMVKYGDAGRIDAILVRIKNDANTNGEKAPWMTQYEVFAFITKELLSVDETQIVGLGDYVDFSDLAGKAVAIILQK